MKQLYYINGVQINEPNNYPELNIDVTFDADNSSEAVTVNSWEIGVNNLSKGNDGLVLANNYIEQGLTGGTGVFEGLPYVIKLDNEQGTVYTLFDGYLDLSTANIQNGLITATAIEQGKLDWLNDVADSFSFEYLAAIGKITTADYIAIPYVINKKINATEVIMLSTTIFVVTMQIMKEIVNLQQLEISAANPLETTAIIRLLFEIIYIIFMFAALIKLIVDLFNMLIQPVKYHYGMKASVLLEKGFEHLGLKFKSSILQTHPYDKLVIIPEKYQIFEDNTGLIRRVTGLVKSSIDVNGFYKGTFGQLLREIKGMFNAKLIYSNETYFLEKQNFINTAAIYQLPNIEDSGHGFNYDEFYSNYLISFQTDLNDKNTIQEYTGTSYQIQQIPKVINNKKMVLAKGLQQVNINFALGKRKTDLNFIEEAMDLLFKTVVSTVKMVIRAVNIISVKVNFVINLINTTVKTLKALNVNVVFIPVSLPKLKTPTIINMIDGTRKNMLKMETDYVAVPKMVIIDVSSNIRNNVLLQGNETYLSAKYLWDNFHYFTSFVEINGVNNQMKPKQTPEIPFTFEDYTKVRTSNKLLTADGKEGKLIKVNFNPDKQTATITYKVKEKYTDNLILKVTEPNGK